MKKHLFLLLVCLTSVLGLKAAGPSGTLPVIYINIENGQEVVSKETYLNANYWLDPKGQTGIEAIGSQEKPLTTKIKGRGNYTFTGFDKKPYRLKLDKKAALCGMKSSKHFGLLAHADDNRGFLRNTLGFKISELVGLPWTPGQYPVELVVNGTYRGLYFLTQLIRIDSDRVNITKWGEEDENGNALSKWIEGGSLVELDNYEEEAQIQFNNPGAPEPLRFTYDKSVDPGFEPDGYINWLKSNLGKVNDLILNGPRDSEELWKYVDIDDLARFIVVQELTDNYESFHGSCYLFRELGDNEKWHFSPVWDFGSAFQRQHPNQPFYTGSMHYNHWIAELMEYPALKKKVGEYWAQLKEHMGELNTYADNFIAQIKKAAAADKERWPQYGNDDLDGKLRDVKNMLNISADFLNRTYGTTPDPSDETFYLVGSFNYWTLADANYKFVKEGDYYVYTCTNGITLKDEGMGLGWKINNGAWALNFGDTSTGNISQLDKTYTVVADGKDILFDIPAGAKIIFDYQPNGTSTVKISLNGGNDDPIVDTDAFYLVGSFNTWTLADAKYKFVKEGDSYVYTCKEGITLEDKAGKGWKINNGTWDLNYGDTSEGNISQLEKTYDLKFDGKNILLDIPAGAKIIFDYEPNGVSTVKINAKSDNNDEPVFNDTDFYLAGLFSSWTKNEKYKFVNEGTRYTYVLPEAITDEWKIFDGTTGWTVNFGSSADLQYNTAFEGVKNAPNIQLDLPAGSRIVLEYNPQGKSKITVQTDWSVEEYRKNVRFIDAHQEPWQQAYAHVYNGDNPSESFSGSGFPGAPMIREMRASSNAVTAQEPNVWTYSFNPEKFVRNLRVVYSNGEEGEGNCTPECKVSEEYTRTGQTTVVATPENAAEYTVSAQDGTLVVESAKAIVIQVADITGRVQYFEVVNGVTYINLGHGIYIVDGKKFCL